MWYDTTVGAHYSYGSPESTANAWEIYNYFRSLSTPWAVESIAALCGNFQLESVMNPCIRNVNQSGAFGLPQWITHKSTMIAWANTRGLRPTSGTAQVQYIEAERRDGVDDQYLPRGLYANVTFNDFAYNLDNLDVVDLTRCWWVNYERSAEYQTDRETWAQGFYQLFQGQPPITTLPKWLLYKLKGDKKRVRTTVFI